MPNETVTLAAPPVLDGATAPVPSLYINRELSWVQYDRRVLDEALSERQPLLEQAKFLAIFHSMLDEFFMVRVAGLREQVKAGVSEPSPDGMTPSEELTAVRAALAPLQDQQYDYFRRRLLPALATQGIRIVDYSTLDAGQRAGLRTYFETEVFPVCTPLAVDPGHPFPHISNLSLNLAVILQDPERRRRFARVKVPNVLPRLVPVGAPDLGAEGRAGTGTFVWLEQVLAAHLDQLFPMMEIVEVHPFRVIRDADIEIQELEAADLLETVEEGLSQRRFGSVVALLVNPNMPDYLLHQVLMANLEVGENDIYLLDGPLGLSDLMEITRLERADLKDPPFTPRPPVALRDSRDIFTTIQEGDILLHHPYDTFTTVVDFINAAADDPQVLAIKQTLYRVGSHSPIVAALQRAAEAGKQVAVLVELKARFDEENNIEWAKALEQGGVHVTYGLIGLKTHCKLALVVRKERDGLRRYVHLGTGNYNPGTARGYTDLGVLTCRADLGADVSDLFNYLTGYSRQTVYRKLLVAPVNMRQGILARIEREIAAHKDKDKGKGRLIFKMNALVDPAMIDALYRASQAGVRVDLIVRGICCLRPGVAGISENIRVISLIGRFLEHSRLYYFRNGGEEEVLIGSADLMPRNLDNRVETLYPLESPALKRYLVEDLLKLFLKDNVEASVLDSMGAYTHLTPAPGEAPVNAQAILLARSLTGPEVTPPPTAKRKGKHHESSARRDYERD